MKRSNLRMSFVVAILILSFVVSTVGAEGEPPVVDSDEPLVTSSSVLITEDFEPSDELLSTDITPPYPLNPANYNYITNRLPRLYFARHPQATAYKIFMYDIRSVRTLVYAYQGGTENCGTTYCWLQPTTKLKTWKIDVTSGGTYEWKVEAKVGTSWVFNENYGIFTVFSTGFTSTFDVNTRGWEAINGTWTRTASGYYKTPGSTSSIVNAWRKEFYFDGAVVEVRMKRKGEVSLADSCINFLGYPTPLFGPNIWHHGYRFCHYNDGQWVLYKALGGSNYFIMDGSSTAIQTSDWNTFKLWKHNETLFLWINGVYITAIADESDFGGAVGLSMFEADPDKSPLLVDYVKVYYSATWPEAAPLDEAIPTEPVVELAGGVEYSVK